MTEHAQPVLILGAGVNGCALARELVLNGVPVHLVDERDIGFGATAKSSRLIHGGLRYLEYADFRLVKESLAERARLLESAPQYVQPLRLYIPVPRRRGGMLAAAVRFFGLDRRSWLGSWTQRVVKNSVRGMWVVRMGLAMYDRLAGSEGIEPHEARRVGHDALAPRVDPDKYRWLCAYTDAQMVHPERFLVAMLEDARRLAEEQQLEFRVWSYHHARLHAGGAEILPRHPPEPSRPQGSSDAPPVAANIAPALIVNATGAWGDFTLLELKVDVPPLFGGTKGSHFVTFHALLRERLGEHGVYAETPDGRLVFVLPFGEGTLVGTTDIPFAERPERAVAEPDEIDYLLETVNQVFDGVRLARGDVALHYSGVRPLPRSEAGSPEGVSRDHWIVSSESVVGEVLTLVGGKLTTCRAFAEIAADEVFRRLETPRRTDSRTRVFPGGEAYPANAGALREGWDRVASSTGCTVAQVRAMWTLWGTRVEEIATSWNAAADDPAAETHLENLWGTSFPIAAVRWIIRHEWVRRLEDLVERRLLLVYHPALARRTLREAAELLAEAGRYESQEIDAAISECEARLQEFYGRTLPAD